MSHILGVQVRCEAVSEYESFYLIKCHGTQGDYGVFVHELEYEVLKKDVGVSAYLPKPGELYTLTLGQ